MIKKNKTKIGLFSRFAVVISLVLGTLLGPVAPVYAACGDAGSSFALGIPTWYKYLPNDDALGAATGRCVPSVNSVDDFLLIGLAIVEILLRIGTYIAIAMFIYGAIRMIISQGSPEEVKKSRDTITNAVIGLVIALLSTAVVNFMGRTLG